MSYTETKWPVTCPLCSQQTYVDGDGILFNHNGIEGEECSASGQEYLQ